MTRSSWSSDEELFSLVRRRLCSAVVGDILDTLGHRHRFLPPSIRPLHARTEVLVGRAMPVLEADVADGREPFGRMFEALDELRPGEIYLAAGGNGHYAFFGELMAVAATARGAAGAVLCGYHRDSAALLAGDFPVYSKGAYAQDQGVRGRVIDFRTTVEIGAVRVDPGDLVVADVDGVVVVPAAMEREVVDGALEKVSLESHVRDALRTGMSVREAFERFGVM